MSRQQAHQIAQRLKFPEAKAEIFCDMVDSVHARSTAKKSEALARVKDYLRKQEARHLPLDEFDVFSDWYHLAIFEMTFFRGFRNDSKWIAQILGISPEQAAESVLLLLQAKILKKHKGTLKPTSKSVVTYSDVPSQKGIAKFNRQLLDKARNALDAGANARTTYGSFILRVSSKELVKARDMVRAFLRDFSRTFEEGDDQDSLFCLAIHFFDVTCNPL